MTSIQLNSITGLNYPYDVYVCDVYGNNCGFISTISTSVPAPVEIVLPIPFNYAPAVGIKIITSDGCERFKIFNCDVLAVTGLVWETTNNTSGVTGCETAGWVISNLNQTIQFNCAADVGCGGTCAITQYGTATAIITVGAEDTNLTVSITGMAEGEDPGFENCSFFLDGNLVVSGTSLGGGLGCTVVPVVQTIIIPGPYPLLASTTHTFYITFTTTDPAYNLNCYYQVNLGFT